MALRTAVFAGWFLAGVAASPFLIAPREAVFSGRDDSFKFDLPPAQQADVQAADSEDARRLIIEIHFCESTLSLFNVEGLRPIWTESEWTGEGAAIFLAVYLGIFFVLVSLASIMDCRLSPVLQRIREARIEANQVHHGHGGALKQSLVERYGSDTELVSKILDMVQEQQEEAERNNKKAPRWRVLLRPSAEDARKKVLIQACARYAASFCSRYYLGGLEPEAFQHIRSEEMHEEGQAAIQEFLLLSQASQTRIIFLMSVRLVAGFFPHYALSRAARVAATLVRILAAMATACIVTAYMGWKVGREEKCHPTEPMLRWTREVAFAFVTLILQEVPYSVLLWMYREGFIQANCTKRNLVVFSFLKRRLFWFHLWMWFYLSLFVIVQFLATSAALDRAHWLFVCGLILIISIVVKPVVVSGCGALFWTFSSNLGVGGIQDEMHHCLRPSNAAELTSEDFERLDQKFLGQLLTEQGGDIETGSAKKNRKHTYVMDADDSQLGEEASPPAVKDAEPAAEPSVLDQLLEAELKAAEAAVQEKSATEHFVKAGAPGGHWSETTAVVAKDPDDAEDLEEFESWTPLQSEQSFEQPAEAASSAGAPPGSGVVHMSQPPVVVDQPDGPEAEGELQLMPVPPSGRRSVRLAAS